MKYYTIYKTVNKINGKIYVGKHQCDDPYDDYIGSGTLLIRAIEKYGIENFEKTVLYIFDNAEDMNQKEIEIINEEFILREDTYNIGLGGQGGKLLINKTVSKETKEKMRKAVLGSKKNLSQEQRKAIGNKTKEIHTGLKRSEETRNKIKAALTGKVKSEESKIKASESVKKTLSLIPYTCDVCGKEGKGGGMKAYHFGNCKKRAQNDTM